MKTDVGPILPTELPYLSPKEKKDNVRLSCQIKVRVICQSRFRRVFNIREYVATVSSIEDVTHDIKEVFFSIQDENKFQSWSVRPAGCPCLWGYKRKTMRAYSMSSQPSVKNGVELLIRLVPNGIVTTYVTKCSKWVTGLKSSDHSEISF